MTASYDTTHYLPVRFVEPVAFTVDGQVRLTLPERESLIAAPTDEPSKAHAQWLATYLGGNPPEALFRAGFIRGWIGGVRHRQTVHEAMPPVLRTLERLYKAVKDSAAERYATEGTELLEAMCEARGQVDHVKHEPDPEPKPEPATSADVPRGPVVDAVKAAVTRSVLKRLRDLIDESLRDTTL